ncbi:sulfatase [Haloferula helveola]|uniref:Sulfatase n=1 Tax=Haloferula helveola TaxID=490095 RepID=A0ABM7RBZ0_9BACT|nr:sulfatase [Haloferula helveola]
MPDPFSESQLLLNRRHFFGKTAKGVGVAALASLLDRDLFAAGPARQLPDYAPKAKRMIYLFQSGAPSQQDLFDPKPKLNEHFGEELSKHVEVTQRKTGMTMNQKSFPLAGSKYQFTKHGQSGAEISELLPHISGIADDICLIRSMYTEAINHDPAITFFQTGSQIPGRPSIGSWLSYGLGSVNRDLPDFVAMVSRGTGRPNCQPLYDRLWGSGFLPTQHAGVKFMSIGDPVLYLSNPTGFPAKSRRRMLDDLAELNEKKLNEFADPEIATRIKQYELAYRMQTSVPELTDISDEPESILQMYGPNVKKRGSYAYNCLMARRLAERDVRFVQLFHMGWDQHFTLPKQLPGQCQDTDQPSAALIKDLKMRGLLDDTLVVWGGEFGRTSYCQGKLARDNYGRDHHPRCFSIWAAGGGIKPGMTYGATDDFSYNITEKPVHVHDLHATILHQLGVDHEKLTYKFQGRQFRLTDVHGHLVKDILA